MELSDNAQIFLEDNKFIFKDITLTDTAYKTKALFNGLIAHRRFTDWYLDLKFDTQNKRFLALNTSAKDNDLFYGTGFIVGKANIIGDVNALTINVNAVTGEGTKFKIPLSDTQTVGDDSFITFVSKEKTHQDPHDQDLPRAGDALRDGYPSFRQK